MTEEPYYIVEEGTNIYDRIMVNSDTFRPKIFDTEEIAQAFIDEDVESRKGAKIHPSEGRVPISVAEYNEKYGEPMRIKED